MPHGGDQGAAGTRGRRTSRRSIRSVLVAVLAVVAASLVPLVIQTATAPAHAATSCPAEGCTVTIDAHDFASGSPLANFTFIVNDDNSKLPSDPLSLSTESNSPIVAEGNDQHNTVTLPEGR